MKPRVFRRDDLAAEIRISCRDPERGRRIDDAIGEALEQAAELLPTSNTATLRARTRRRAAALRAAELERSFVIVPVTRRNARHLLEILESVRAGGALGVQLVWDGQTDRDVIEPHVFAALESARQTKKLGPVILATRSEPCFVLRAQARTDSHPVTPRTETTAC